MPICERDDVSTYIRTKLSSMMEPSTYTTFLVEELDNSLALDRLLANYDEADSGHSVHADCLFSDDANSTLTLHRVGEEGEERFNESLLVRRDRIVAGFEVVVGGQRKEVGHDS